MFAVLLFCCFAVQGQAANIHIVLSEQNEAYQTISNDLIKAISQQQVNVPVKVDSLAEFDSRRLATDDLIITVGNQAALSLSKMALSQPAILSFSDQQMLPEPTNWVAPVISQPVQRLAIAFDSLLDRNFRNRILVVVASENRFALKQLQTMQSLTKGKLEVIQLPETDSPAKLIEDKLFNAGALIAINDQRIWSGENARWMLYQAYRYKVPVIGYSKKFLTAGALLSVYSTSEQIAQTTAKEVTSWLKKGHFTKTGVIYSDYNIEYNKNIARALDVDVPANQQDIKAGQ